jgi:hypothetical protein
MPSSSHQGNNLTYVALVQLVGNTYNLLPQTCGQESH